MAAGLATALAACAPALVAAFRDARRQRNEVVGICAVLVGGLALALVVGAGRGDHGPTAGIQHRYAVMSLLIVYALYFAAVVAGRTSSPGRALQWVGLLAGILALVPAAKDGVRNGRHLERTLREAERKIPVLPDDVLGAELETLLHGGEAPVLEAASAVDRLVKRAGRRADAERQIDVLEQQGLVREAALLRALGAGRRPPD